MGDLSVVAKSEQDIVALRKIGRVVALALQAMEDQLRPGMTTKALDDIGAEVLARNKARSAPILTYNFPGANCISVNDQAAHGIPGNRIIQEGDLVKLDVSAELEGYFADANLTIRFGQISARKRKLIDCTRRAMEHGIAAARAGRPLNAIGKAAEEVVKHGGFSVIHELPGHGIGKG